MIHGAAHISSNDLPGGGAVRLRRSIGLPLAVLYGLGVTVGAGIYVLVGAVVGRAGVHAPVAFVLAGAVMALTAASFAELARRHPVSAGEAAYVRAGLGSRKLALLVGLAVTAAGIISAGAISHGAAGYLAALTGIGGNLLLPWIVVGMGGIAAWGITQSALIAGAMTLIEITGLLLIIGMGLKADPGLLARLPEAWPPVGEQALWSGVLAAGLLSFFAFIGFEGLVNIAEEVKDPERTIPRAILWTLVITTVLYILVVWVAITAVPREELAASRAPLSLVFMRVTGAGATVVTVIAVVATINGIIAQIVMSSRVLYGLARQGQAPAALGEVDPRTRTPLVATGLVVAAVLVLGMAVPIEPLAEATSRLMLAVFALVNAALVAIKLGERDARGNDGFTAPLWVPVAGAASCAALLVAELIG